MSDGSVFLSQIENENNTIIIRSFTGSEVSAIAMTDDKSSIFIGDMSGNTLWTSIWDQYPRNNFRKTIVSKNKKKTKFRKQFMNFKR